MDLDELESEGHEWDHGQLLRAELRTLRARVAALEKLFDDAGQGEHNVLALIDHCQSEAMAESERRRTRELEALIAFERYFRATKRYVQHGGPFPAGSINDLLKAIDEARK